MVAQLAPLCQHFFYKVCPKTVRRSVPFLPRFARFYSILLYIGGAKTHFFAGKKIFAPPRRKCGFRRQFSTKAAENSHPAGGKIRPLFRCFTRVFHGGKSARKIGWQRRFFTRFSGKIHAVFFIIIYRFYGAKLSARPHDLPLPFTALQRGRGQAFRLCRNCRAAAGAFRVGGKRRCRRRQQAFPQGGKTELRLHAPHVPRVLHAACGGFPVRYKM